MASAKGLKKEDPISFLHTRPTIFISQLSNIKHLASLYNSSVAYLAGMKRNTGKFPPYVFKFIDDMYFSRCPCFESGADNGSF
jgi:hypothetical protein